jgi:hypothetical protein
MSVLGEYGGYYQPSPECRCRTGWWELLRLTTSQRNALLSGTPVTKLLDEDFASRQLPEEDLNDLRSCRVGACEVKLGAEALRTFRTQVDWNNSGAAAEANAIFRRLALDYVVRYGHGGNTDYWQDTEFGLKPVIRISHVASHYFWTALELRVLLPDPPRGDGFWFITVSRSRSDGLSGFTGRFVRGRVRSEARSGTLTALAATKTKLEASLR